MEVLQWIYDKLDWIDGNILWGIPMIVLILGCGIFITVRTKALQVRKFGYTLKQTMGRSIRQMKGEKLMLDDDGANLSPFEAFSTAISGTVGTGNIVGVTSAIISGGPGAVFWMWVSAFFGMITKFAEITLGVFFRKKDEKGEYIGGPMFYIEKGLKQKWLAVLFAVFAMLAAIGMSSVQAKTIQGNWKTTFDMPIWVTAIIIAVLAGIVIIGGIKRIGKVASMLVPFMAIFFVIMAVINVCCNITSIPDAFSSIFSSAFTAKSAVGGFIGYGIQQAMRFGVARGIFSNESGLGSSPMAHTNASEIEPVRQGMWGVFEVFFDTFVICTLTALFVLTSGLDVTVGLTPEQIKNIDAEVVALNAFTNMGGVFGEICKYSFAVILPMFAFTTILAWAVYGSKACKYIFKGKYSELVFNIIYIVMIIVMGLITFFAGDNLASGFVWLISDMTNALMAIPNLIAVICLSGLLIKIVKNYFDRKNGKDVVPMLSAYDDVNNELAQKIKGQKID